MRKRRVSTKFFIDFRTCESTSSYQGHEIFDLEKSDHNSVTLQDRRSRNYIGEQRMSAIEFPTAFKHLTGNDPFPWQQDLYENWFSQGKFPQSCNLPTGLGKTSVIAVWLIALANNPEKTPRRLVYVVNRRTVVDQTTVEVEKYREKLKSAGLWDFLSALTAIPLGEHDSPLAISTLRGQFADNREWSADPSRPAVICGTVDMIGSRLLFSGYGIGFKARPLHAGFLGQDALLIHDEAHLEPAFQTLLESIVEEQKRAKEFRSFHVVELTATPRSDGDTFPKPDEKERNDLHPIVRQRVFAKKKVILHPLPDDKDLVDDLCQTALSFKDSGRKIIVFVRKVDDVDKICKKLPKDSFCKLTGTLRGFERDDMVVSDEVFKQFLPEAPTQDKTVYLVATSAGEVGVNLSADHLLTDLSTFESMAQRFGRVNRFGKVDDTEIHIFHPVAFAADDAYEVRRQRTYELMTRLNGDGSPNALGGLSLKDRQAAFAPEPVILPASRILFDAWALTTIRERLPGRPPVAPYLHGVAEWQPPETYVAWREEVEVIAGELLNGLSRRDLAELLEDYPLVSKELLRDSSARVFDRLKKMSCRDETPVWLISEDDSVEVTDYEEVIRRGKEEIESKTVLLPPSAGGLEKGMLSGESAPPVADISDIPNRRLRLRGGHPEFETLTQGMRLIRRIDFPISEEASEDDDPLADSWYWYERPTSGLENSKNSVFPVRWQDHTDDVVENVTKIVAKAGISTELQKSLIHAARYHDLGKRRTVWQRSIGNLNPRDWYAKSGKGWRPLEITKYRHEFGSLMELDSQTDFAKLEPEKKDLIRHLVAAHHGRSRPHFKEDEAFDPDGEHRQAHEIANAGPIMFAGLQRQFGRWGLAYLESLLRAADYAASANPKPPTGGDR
jgi:CRISPR-associated endonuclease/helicase Cas3